MSETDVIVRAIRTFMDARTGRDYRPGDVVVGWDKARAEHYAAAGLVSVVEVKPTKSPSKSRKKVGPAETKPAKEPIDKKAVE